MNTDHKLIKPVIDPAIQVRCAGSGSSETGTGDLMRAAGSYLTINEQIHTGNRWCFVVYHYKSKK